MSLPAGRHWSQEHLPKGHHTMKSAACLLNVSTAKLRSWLSGGFIEGNLMHVGPAENAYYSFSSDHIEFIRKSLVYQAELDRQEAELMAAIAKVRNARDAV